MLYNFSFLSNNKSTFNLSANPIAIVVPAAPEIIPQMSPITSLQKLEVREAF